jgi:uncharacterized protein
MTSNRVAVNAHDVANYLRQHPDFFQHHLGLLATLYVPHPSGNAVSLVAKQLDIFRAKHQELEQQLVNLINIARKNDNSFHRLHQLTLTLLEASTLEQAISQLEIALADFFMSDFITIRFIQDPARATTRTDLCVAPDDARLQVFSKTLEHAQTFCGRPTACQTQFLFAENALAIQSCAIIPIVYPQLKAILAVGSCDAAAFHPDMGNIFLTQISEIVATRLISLLPA